MPAQLAELLTMRAFEVEGMEKIGNETFIDINVLANRGRDALSHIGMAREICALENKKLKYKFAKLPRSGRTAATLSVEIKDKKLCPRYIGKELRVKIRK